LLTRCTLGGTWLAALRISDSPPPGGLHASPTRRSSDLFRGRAVPRGRRQVRRAAPGGTGAGAHRAGTGGRGDPRGLFCSVGRTRSEEHTSELQSRENLGCRLLLANNERLRGGLTGPRSL